MGAGPYLEPRGKPQDPTYSPEDSRELPACPFKGLLYSAGNPT